MQHNCFRYKAFHINKNQPLGHGAYGAVYEAKCDQLPCAAKVLHPTIVDPSNHDPGAGKIMDRFSQECALLESIRHPNIVQYLGITVDPESRLPVLLIELLDENLTNMLERSPLSLAYCVQVDICHDIALAVTYLHSNDIIHRDLSSNNVLIIAERRAKVTDFGMSKLTSAAPTVIPLTMCPGTQAYMPPEALREPPRYTKKLDCFSEGVVMIQVCTRLWPEPGPRTQIIQYSRSPTGTMEMPVLEPERRKNHINLIDPTHPILPIAVECLCFQEMERPSSEELCQRLAGLKESTMFRESMDQQLDEIRVKDYQICELMQELQEKDRLLQEMGDNVPMKGEQIQIQVERTEINEKDQRLQQKERQHQVERAILEIQLLHLNRQLKEQEQVTAEIKQTSHSLQRQVEQLQQQLSQQKHGPPQPPPSACLEEVDKNAFQEKPSPPEQLPVKADRKSYPPKHWVKTSTWRSGGKAPFKMVKGAAVVDGNVSYFMDWNGKTCSYISSSKQWIKLPKYPYTSSILAVVNGLLTAIGGCGDVLNQRTYTNKLLSLRESWIHHKIWSDVFPPMPTKRRGSTAVTSKEHLIVAGGSTGPNLADNINTVEVMDTKTLVWSTVASLPHSYDCASAAICGDHLYMLGGHDEEEKTKSVLTCSLTELLQSSSSSSVWHRVADAPDYYSTCTAVNGQLLAVGGCDVDDIPTGFIHIYNPTSNSWDVIGNMPTARNGCLVADLPNNEMMVVGGRTSTGKVKNDRVVTKNTDTVVITTLN